MSAKSTALLRSEMRDVGRKFDPTEYTLTTGDQKGLFDYEGFDVAFVRGHIKTKDSTWNLKGGLSLLATIFMVMSARGPIDCTVDSKARTLTEEARSILIALGEMQIAPTKKTLGKRMVTWSQVIAAHPFEYLYFLNANDITVRLIGEPKSLKEPWTKWAFPGMLGILAQFAVANETTQGIMAILIDYFVRADETICNWTKRTHNADRVRNLLVLSKNPTFASPDQQQRYVSAWYNRMANILKPHCTVVTAPTVIGGGESSLAIAVPIRIAEKKGEKPPEVGKKSVSPKVSSAPVSSSKHGSKASEDEAAADDG
jgi:hypothetical protein